VLGRRACSLVFVLIFFVLSAGRGRDEKVHDGRELQSERDGRGEEVH